MNCPKCNYPFYTIHVEDIYCRCDPREIRDILAGMLTPSAIPTCAMCGGILLTDAVIRNGNKFCSGCALR